MRYRIEQDRIMRTWTVIFLNHVENGFMNKDDAIERAEDYQKKLYKGSGVFGNEI